MRRLHLLFLVASVSLTACSSGGGGPRGFSFLDPGVRAGQEKACAEAVARLRGVSQSEVRTIRTSADATNGALVMAYTGKASGYCRVSANVKVLQVVF